MAWYHRRPLLYSAILLGTTISLYWSGRLFFAPSAAQACTQIPKVDITQRLTVLGSPFTNRKHAKTSPYARNIWDIFPFQNRLFLGHGDSNTNQGPIPLWYFEPQSQQFKFDFVAPEEQIQTFEAIGKTLYTPGIDARGSWDFGNIYRLRKKGWQKLRTLPGGVHVWSIQGFAQQLWSVIRRPDNRGYLLRSEDGGQTWRDVQVLSPAPAPMVRFQSSLYIFAQRPWQVDSSLMPKQRPDLGLRQLFPEHSQATQVTQTATYQSQLAYLSEVSRYIANTTQSAKVLNREDPHRQPPGLFVAQSLEPGQTQIQRISLNTHEVPWDLFATRKGLYVLTSERTQSSAGQQRFINRIRQATGGQWCEILSFEADTFARSFAPFQGHWYFGLGTDYGAAHGRQSYTQQAHALSGTVLRTQMREHQPISRVVTP